MSEHEHHTSYTDPSDPLHALKTKWSAEQTALKSELVLEDRINEPIRYIAGVDLSFLPDDSKRACAALVILTYPDLKIVYEKYEMVRLTLPYIPSFLAFREVDHLVRLVEEVRKTSPEILPQVILVDGNGYLHPRGFGLACHLGVLAKIPTIGVAKNFFVMDGLSREEVTDRVEKESEQPNQPILLKGRSGTIWGCALANRKGGRRHIYVSRGHRVSLEKATEIVVKCRKYFIPEPIRAADLGSREYLTNLGKGNLNNQ